MVDVIVCLWLTVLRDFSQISHYWKHACTNIFSYLEEGIVWNLAVYSKNNDGGLLYDYNFIEIIQNLNLNSFSYFINILFHELK